jgi:hypothetical protein
MHLCWLKMMKGHFEDASYCTHESWEDAYWRALCGDRSGLGSGQKPAGNAVKRSTYAYLSSRRVERIRLREWDLVSLV